MRTILRLTLVTGVLLLIVGCASNSGVSADTLPDEDAGASGVRSIMNRKLDHSRSLLAAIAVGDYPSVEAHADMLTYLSGQSDWEVHDTAAYVAFSQKFRDATIAMSDAARVRHRDSVTAAYHDMTAACLNCHAYLRDEGLVREMPGLVTWTGDDDLVLAVAE